VALRRREVHLESIEPRLASTTGPSRHEQKDGIRDEQDNDALVNLCILQSCSKRVVTTAAVDVEEKATMAKMLMAPAAMREGDQRPSMVDVG